jgi:hypothetical protein
VFLGGCYKKKPETFYCRIHYATVHLTRTGANRSIFIMLLVFLARTGSRARFVSAKGLQCNVATRALSIPASIVEIRCLNVVVTNSPRQPCELPGDSRAALYYWLPAAQQRSRLKIYGIFAPPGQAIPATQTSIFTPENSCGGACVRLGSNLIRRPHINTLCC